MPDARWGDQREYGERDRDDEEGNAKGNASSAECSPFCQIGTTGRVARSPTVGDSKGPSYPFMPARLTCDDDGRRRLPPESAIVVCDRARQRSGGVSDPPPKRGKCPAAWPRRVAHAPAAHVPGNALGHRLVRRACRSLGTHCGTSGVPRWSLRTRMGTREPVAASDRPRAAIRD